MNCPTGYECITTIKPNYSPETWGVPLLAIGLIIAVVLASIIVYAWVQRRK